MATKWKQTSGAAKRIAARSPAAARSLSPRTGNHGPRTSVPTLQSVGLWAKWAQYRTRDRTLACGTDGLMGWQIRATAAVGAALKSTAGNPLFAPEAICTMVARPIRAMVPDGCEPAKETDHRD